MRIIQSLQNNCWASLIIGNTLVDAGEHNEAIAHIGEITQSFFVLSDAILRAGCRSGVRVLQFDSQNATNCIDIKKNMCLGCPDTIPPPPCFICLPLDVQVQNYFAPTVYLSTFLIFAALWT